MNFSSNKAFLVLGLLVLATAAFAQNEYAGKWTARHPNGGVVTLTLEQQGPGEVVGKLEGSGASFDVDAEVRADGIVGMVTSAQAMVHMTGRITGTTLYVLLVEPGANGEPNWETRRVITFTRP